VVGFDALDQGLVQIWASEGLLPTFKRLMETANWGLVENQPGLQAGSAWPTFYRGVSVGRHGQLDGTRQFDPTKYEIVRAGPEYFEHKLIWQRLCQEGKRVAVVDAPYTHLTPDINGMEIHDWGNHAGADGGSLQLKTCPPGLAEEVLESFGLEPLGGHLCDELMPRNVGDLTAFRDALSNRISSKTAMSKHYLAQGGWDFFLTTFSEAHCAGHHMWHIHDSSRPDHDSEIAKALGDPLRDIYVKLDSALGDILAEVDPNETKVLVYCSHGMGPSVSATRLLDRILVKLEGGEPKDKSKGTEGLLRKGWRGLPDGVQKRLKPLHEIVWKSVVKTAFEGNRDQRKYFEIYANDSTGGVRINLIGREPDGKVCAGEEYDAVLESLTKDLLDITDLETGAPLVKDVIKAKDVYTGEALDKLPDLLVNWNKDAGPGPVRRVFSPKIGTMENDSQPPRTGDHTPNGMYLCLGSILRPGRRNSDASVMDFAPTIARWLDCSLVGFEGIPLDQADETMRSKRHSAAS